MGDFIPLSIPNFEGNEKKYIDDAVEQVWVSTGGKYITKLENQISSFIGVENVAAVQSGTAALHLSLVEIGIVPGDIVIVPALTFIAAVNPVSYMHAKPVFMDCDDSLCMDPQKLEQFCSKECHFDGKTLFYNESVVKAIIVVHVFGNMADMESIIDIANRYNLKVIEDATEALGTKYIGGKYANRYAGTIGDFGCFSFNGNKIITTGGGGAITAKDSNNVDHVRFLSTQAKTDAEYYLHDEVGYNYRMTNIQAALGVAQMEMLQEFIDRKNKNYELYKNGFKDCKSFSLMGFRNGISSNKWFYSLLIDRKYVSYSLREIITKLKEKGIGTRAVWGLINEQKPYVNAVSYRLEKAPYYSQRVLNIPSSTQITEAEIDYVIQEIKNLFKEL